MSPGAELIDRDVEIYLSFVQTPRVPIVWQSGVVSPLETVVQ